MPWAGTKRDTYLEFHKKLKIKKRSEFSLELKTTFEDGIVFYVADETHTDFIALLIKEGRVSETFLKSFLRHGEAEDSFKGTWVYENAPLYCTYSKMGGRGREDGSVTGNSLSFSF